MPNSKVQNLAQADLVESYTNRLKSSKDSKKGLFALILSAWFVLGLVLNTVTGGFHRLIETTTNANMLKAAAEQQAEGIDWGELFFHLPPIRLILGSIAGSFGSVFYGQLFLATVGCIVAVVLLTGLRKLLKQKGIPLPLQIALMGAILATPIIYYTAFYNMSTLLILLFTALGLAHTIRFVQWGSTYSGFIAGLLYAACILTDASGIVYVALSVAAALTFTWVYRGNRGSMTGSVLILLYPALLAIVTLVFVSFSINRSLTEWLSYISLGQVHEFDSVVQNATGNLATTILGIDNSSDLRVIIFSYLLVLMPSFFVVFIAFGWKQRLWSVVAGLILGISQIWIAQLLPGSVGAGNVFLYATVIATVVIAEERMRRQNLLIYAACFFQLVAAWIATWTRPTTLTLWWNDYISNLISFL